jgi:nicotinamidase/pyrazinamidase
MTGTTLLLIDVQKDFHPGGSLAIPTANKDADRIAHLLRQDGLIDRVVATLDSHHKLHIAHPSFWLAGDGSNKHPDPFTIITVQDLEAGVWKPRSDLRLTAEHAVDASVFGDMAAVQNEDGSLDPAKYCIEYARRLETKGRFKICIWPEHCLIGSPGHAIVDNLQQALSDWSDKTGASVDWVLKGQHLLTEMYSALAADVPVSKETDFNESLHQSLLLSEQVVVCGQAMSHCVNYTLRDLVAKWPEDRRSSIVLLSDGASAVPGFEDAASEFMRDMKELGVQIKSVAEFMAEEKAKQ